MFIRAGYNVISRNIKARTKNGLDLFFMIFITKHFGKIALTSRMHSTRAQRENRVSYVQFLFFHRMKNEAVGLCVLRGIDLIEVRMCLYFIHPSGVCANLLKKNIILCISIIV